MNSNYALQYNNHNTILNCIIHDYQSYIITYIHLCILNLNDGVQPDVLQRCRAAMACQRGNSWDVRAATWNVSSMVCLSGEVVDALHRKKLTYVVLKRRGGWVEVR